MPTNSPATPLPWGALEHQHIRPMEDAGYIFHAANAYPQLVEALRYLVNPPSVEEKDATPEHESSILNAFDNARSLLRSLGEE